MRVGLCDKIRENVKFASKIFYTPPKFPSAISPCIITPWLANSNAVAAAPIMANLITSWV